MNDLCNSFCTPCFHQAFFEATGSNCPPQLRGTVEAASSVVRSKAETGGITSQALPHYDHLGKWVNFHNANNLLQFFTKPKQLYTTHDLTWVINY